MLVAALSRRISAIGFPDHRDQVRNKPATDEGSPIWSSDVTNRSLVQNRGQTHRFPHETRNIAERYGQAD